MVITAIIKLIYPLPVKFLLSSHETSNELF